MGDEIGAHAHRSAVRGEVAKQDEGRRLVFLAPMWEMNASKWRGSGNMHLIVDANSFVDLEHVADRLEDLRSADGGRDMMVGRIEIENVERAAVGGATMPLRPEEGGIGKGGDEFGEDVPRGARPRHSLDGQVRFTLFFHGQIMTTRFC